MGLSHFWGPLQRTSAKRCYRMLHVMGKLLVRLTCLPFPYLVQRYGPLDFVGDLCGVGLID